ncbi:MAG: DUF362 domain-containing protein [Candidatus Omnitrophota bacterium]
MKKIWPFFKKKITRKQFIKYSLLGLSGLLFSGIFLKASRAIEKNTFNGRKKRIVKTDHDLVLVEGEDPYKMAVEGVKAMGGMEKFVAKGSTVVVKPNIGWDRSPEYAANTNPFVVAALVEMCYLAGAKKVKVFDRTCNSEARCYESSGIKKAAEEKGASVYFVDDWNYINAKFDYKSSMQDWPIFRDAIECDTFINVPILKHHGLANLTISMKNLMGVCGGSRSIIHQDIGPKLVDITDFIKPDLTIIDAFRVLKDHGPRGGDLKDVVDMKKLIVSTDPTLSDVYAAFLMNKEPKTIPNIDEAIRRNFGKSDLNSAAILKLKA